MLPTVGGDKLIKLHKPQRMIATDFYSGIRNMIFLKSRQIGFSTLFQCVSAHLCTFYKNVIIGVTSKNGGEASDFCKKTKDIILKLPSWIRPEFNIDNAQNFSIKKTNSQLFSSAISPKAPDGLFRGKSIVLLIMDEIAHADYAEDAWTGVAPALSKAQKDAQANGVPFGTILLSTPNKMNGIGKFFFDMWCGAYEGTNSFKPYKVHWTDVDEYKNDPTWYENQKRILNNNSRKIQQELELQFIGDEDTLFPDSVATEFQKKQTFPSSTIRLVNSGELWKFPEKIDLNRFYLISVDVATSYGKDYSAIEVLDYLTLEQIYEYKGKIKPKELTKIIKMLAELCPKNLIIVENSGGYGISILNDLEDDEKEYNIFYESEQITKGNKKVRVNKRMPGLSTNKLTRPLIIESLYNVICENPSLIKSERLKLELLALVNKNGKVQADKNSNDDLVLAYAFGCYVKKFYNNIILQEEDTGVYNEESTYAMDSIYEMNSLIPSFHPGCNFEQYKKDLKRKLDKDPRGITREKILNSIFGNF